MSRAKAILVGDTEGGRLRPHVAGLALPRRALSLPHGKDRPLGLQSFVELWGEEAALRATVALWPLPVRAWLVEEHAPLVYERSWPSGTPSPGVRLVSTLHRCKGMSRDAFARHWLGPHTRVALAYTVPVWHYNQNLVVEALTPDSGVDGFVGMHFETAEQMRARWSDHPLEAARGAADAAQFMDVTRSASMVAEETVWED